MQAARHPQRMPVRRSLTELPQALPGWTGQDLAIEPRILEAIGVNDYINRVYVSPAGELVQLYIGYYGAQHSGDQIHSPKNCLPGAGWEPVRAGRLSVDLGSGSRITVNDYLIEKNPTREVVLYWYQGRGRAVASEYTAKFWLVNDAIRRNRTDGALVRVITTVQEDDTQARSRAAGFVRILYPHLNEFVPN